MIRMVFILLLSLLLTGCFTTKKYYEKHYQIVLCDDLNGEIEFVLQDRTRVDCLTDEYAIEVEFAKKWAESIGQSLFYAKMTDKKPAVGLIMDRDKDKRYLKRLDLIAKEYGIKVFVIDK